MGFPRQEYWSGLPFPSPGDLPDLGIKPGSPPLQTDALPSEPAGKPLRAHKDRTIFTTQNLCTRAQLSWVFLLKSECVKISLLQRWEEDQEEERRQEREEGRVEAQILLFSPSSPLLLPPSFLGLPALSLLPHSTTRTEAMFASRDPGPSLLGGLNALLPNPPSPLGFRPFPLPGGPHRTQPTQLGAPPGRQCSGDLSVCPPNGVLRNPKTGIKAFKTGLFTSKTIPYFHSQGSSWDEGLKTTMYSSKSWSVPASARLCPGHADTGRPSPRPMCLVAKSCPTLCAPMDLACQVSRPMGILQVRILEWVACPPPGDLPKPGIDPGCPALQADSYRLSPQGSPLWRKPPGGRRKPKHNLGPGGLCLGGQTLIRWV